MRFISNLLVFSAFYVWRALAADIPTVASTVHTDPVPVREILTNEGIVLLSDAGFSDAFIAEKLTLSRTRVDTSAEGLASLLRSGVSPQLLQFVMERAAQPAAVPTALPTAAPSYVPMKVVKRKVLVPDTTARPFSPAEASMPAVALAPKAPRARHWFLFNWHSSNVAVNAVGSTQAGDSVLSPAPQSPALPAAVTAPAVSTGWGSAH